MGDVVSLDEARPHTSGPCTCLGCHHEWVGAVPVGVDVIQCPRCLLDKGVRAGLVLSDTPVLMCAKCDNTFLLVTMDCELLCPVCGEYGFLPD